MLKPPNVLQGLNKPYIESEWYAAIIAALREEKNIEMLVNPHNTLISMMMYPQTHRIRTVIFITV